MSLKVVFRPSRTTRPLRNRTSLTPVKPFEPTPFRTPSIMKTRTPGNVRKHSRAHFSTSCGGTIASAVNGRPSAWVKTLPSEMSVLPVPHSATAAAHRASCHRLAIPMIARVCAGNGRLFSRHSAGEAGAVAAWRGGKLIENSFPEDLTICAQVIPNA